MLSGVLVATLLSTWVGLTWWSLGAAIAASLLLGKVLRLGDQALETPITAMLILGVANHDIAAGIRIINTLIGAGVGVAMNLIYPPAMPTASAGRALLRVVDAAASPLDAAADALVAGPVSRGQVWTPARTAPSRHAPGRHGPGHHQLAQGQSPVQPAGTRHDRRRARTGDGLDTLEHCLLDIRSLLTVISAETPVDEQPDDPFGEELRAAFAVVLHDAADCVRAFGGLVIAEAEDREDETEEALAQSLEVLRETRAILTELMMVNAPDTSPAWMLRGSILAALGQVLTRLDLEERARLHRT